MGSACRLASDLSSPTATRRDRLLRAMQLRSARQPPIPEMPRMRLRFQTYFHAFLINFCVVFTSPVADGYSHFVWISTAMGDHASCSCPTIFFARAKQWIGYEPAFTGCPLLCALSYTLPARVAGLEFARPSSSLSHREGENQSKETHPPMAMQCLDDDSDRK